MAADRESLVQRFLELGEALYELLAPTFSFDQIASDVTVAQLRVLVILRDGGPTTMSALAASARVVPSSATGIVDNLVGRGLVVRKADQMDRRRIICQLSPEGQQIVNSLWTQGRSQIESLLDAMDEEQLEYACEVTESIYQKMIEMKT